MTEHFSDTNRASLCPNGLPRGGNARRIAVAACAAALTVSLAAPAPAGDDSRYRYTDRDTHPARVASYALHPAGTLLEWLVFRPLHFVGSRLAPRQRDSATQDLGCQRERPLASCTDVIK